MLKFIGYDCGLSTADEAATDQELISKITTVYNEMRTQNIINTYYNSDAYFDENMPTPTSSLYNIINGIIKLEGMKNKRANIPTIRFSTTQINARPNEDGFMRRYAPHRWIEKNTDDYALCIIKVKRGMNYFEACDSWATAHPDAYEIISDEKLKPLQHGHRLKTYKYSDKSICIITDTATSEWAAKAYALMPILIPDLRYLAEKDNPCRLIFSALFDNNAETMRPVLEWTIQEFETIKTSLIYAKLDAALQKQGARQQTIAKTTLDTAKANFNSVTDLYKQRYQEFIDAQNIYNKFLQDTIVYDKSLLEFLKKANNIDFVDCTDSKFTINITTPILNYRTNDVASWYKRSESNCVTQYPALGALIYDAFINNKYKLITTTQIIVPFNPNSTGWSCMAVYKNSYFNPHMVHYNCWRNTMTYANKELLNGNIVAAVNYVISACNTITFTDSAVINYLISDLLNTYNNAKCWQDTEGVLHSTAELTSKRYNNFNSCSGPDIIKELEALNETDKT